MAAAVVTPHKYTGSIHITIHPDKSFESNIPSVNAAKTLTEAIQLFHDVIQEWNSERGMPQVMKVTVHDDAHISR